MHECAFIGDDSSEELEELVEVAKEEGLLDVKGVTEVLSFLKNRFFFLLKMYKILLFIPYLFLLQTARLSNVPDKMRRADQDVHFYHEDRALRLNVSKSSKHQQGSHELDAETMRNILTQLLAKTDHTKKKQKKNPHHHYEAVFREITNIDKPVTNYPENLQNQLQEKSTDKFESNKRISENSTKCVIFLINTSNNLITISL